MRRILAAIGAGLGLVLLARSASADDDDAGDVDVIDVLARVIAVETSGRGTAAEHAGIVHVALNRARGWNAPVSDVVHSRVPGRPEWGSGCGDGVCDYNDRLARVRSTGLVDLVKRILAGDPPNPIGARRNFLHPDHSTFTRDRARGTAAERQRARELRRRARTAGRDAAELYRQANQVERVDPRYAWEPVLERYLPSWSVDPAHGGQARHRPLTLGRTRFS